MKLLIIAAIFFGFLVWRFYIHPPLTRSVPDRVHFIVDNPPLEVAVLRLPGESVHLFIYSTTLRNRPIPGLQITFDYSKYEHHQSTADTAGL